MKVSKDELGTTMEEVQERIKTRKDVETQREVSKVRLFSHRPF
ncbi:MAG: hypothetical protein ACXABZ_12465 [Candidatus Thorarchaeota archaeon]